MAESNMPAAERMTPDERRRAVAELLAMGLVRLRGKNIALRGEEGELDLGFCPAQSVHGDPVLPRPRSRA